MLGWTSRFPDRFAYEVAEMEAVGFHLDEPECQSTGRVVFNGTLDWDGGLIELTVEYPDNFPFFRPEVRATGLRLDRHQNPYEGNLCLLDRSSRAWDTTDTGAWLVRERVPYLLELLAEGGERIAAEETPQGEPMSRYFLTEPGTVVLIPEAMLNMPADVESGTAQISIGEHEAMGQNLRGCLTRVSTRGPKKKDIKLANVDGALARRFKKKTVALRWYRLPALPDSGNKATDLLHAAQQLDGFREPTWNPIGNGVQMSVVGLIVEEEIRQGQYDDAWLFVVRLRRHTQNAVPYTVRGHRFAAEDLAERIPALRGLITKKVALIGLGALGGPLALELARAQVGELRILDRDTVDAGTIVRWPRGVSATGHIKTQVVADQIAVDYPYTKVRRYDLVIGTVTALGQRPAKTQDEIIGEFLDGVDIVVDASAEIGVQQYIASLADDRGLPQMYLWATEGGWGGAVARVMPGATGCWYCLQMHLDDATIATPPHDKTGRVQPRGCDNPTFTATSFDALAIVAQATRAITATLLHGRAADTTDDVFICSQQPNGTAIVAPAWTASSLDSHSKCPLCHPATAR